MKKGKLLRIGMMAALVITLLVSCTSEISEESSGGAMISFAPSVSKALNQKGDGDSTIQQGVDYYYWKYYCSTVKPERNSDSNYDDLDWKPFTAGLDSELGGKGLGIIQNLVKGENYYFGLRGFSSSGMPLDDLVWEGFHYSSQPEALEEGVSLLESVKLTSKNQLITIDVYNAGVGRLFFNMSAPAVNGFCIGDSAAAENFKVGDEVKYDFFTYTLSSLPNGQYTTSNTDLLVTFEGTEPDTANSKYGYYTSETDEFWYNDYVTGSTGTEYPAGTYLMTIWQNNFSKDNTDDDHPEGKYKIVSQRKQVLIVNIVPGVNTVIAGSLDSTALETFEFDGNFAFKVIFHQEDPDDVAPLATGVFNPSGYEAKVEKNWRVPVVEDEYVEIRWLPVSTATTAEDLNNELASVKLYVNGEELTKVDGNYGSKSTFYVEGYTDFYYRSSGKPVYVRNLRLRTVTVGGATYIALDCYGKYGTDYMIDIIYNEQSKSYTIVGIEEKAAVSTASFDNATLTDNSGYVSLVAETTQTDLKIVSGSIATSDANAFVAAVATGDYAGSDYTKSVDISLSVAEIEDSSTAKSFDISLNGSLTSTKDDDSKTFTGEIHNVSDYVIAEIQLDTGLEGVTVTHSGYAMQSVDNVLDPGVSDSTQKIDEDTTIYLGFYNYNASTGVLTIKTKSFSTFTVKLGDYVAKVNDRGYTTLEAAFASASKNETIKLEKDVVLKKYIPVSTTLTLNLNGKKVTAPQAGFTEGNTTDSMFVVNYGGKFTVMDPTGEGSIVGSEKVYVGIKMTEAGETYSNKDAILIVNNGKIMADVFGISGNNKRPHTQVTINGGTVKATSEVDGIGIYNPQDGTLTINGGTIQGFSTAVEIRSGDLVVTGGSLKATATTYSCKAASGGTTTIGAALAIAQHVDKVDITVKISGGTFEGVKAISESNPQGNDTAPMVNLSITGGKFVGGIAFDDSDIEGDKVVSGQFNVDMTTTPTNFLVNSNSYVLANYPDKNWWTVARRVI